MVTGYYLSMEEDRLRERRGTLGGEEERLSEKRTPPTGEWTDAPTNPPEHQHHNKRQHRRHKHHHHRMRMHDGNIRKLLDVDVETFDSCDCDCTESHDRVGPWGTRHPSRGPNTSGKTKKNHCNTNSITNYGSHNSNTSNFNGAPNIRRMRSQSSGGYLGGHREPSKDDDSFRFRHYEDPGLYMQQYRDEHSICIQGADPTAPPVLGLDTPDPYLAKLRQCGDLLERLMAFTAMARQQQEEQEHSHFSDRALMKALLPERSPRGHSASSTPEMTSYRAFPPRRAINLAPVRDCRLAVKNIKFPQAAPPKRLPGHIQQQQVQQQQQQHQNNLLAELQSPRIAFPLPVRIVLNSETLRGNKLGTLSPPRTPPRGRHRHLNDVRGNGRNHTAVTLSKRRSDIDFRYPQLPSANTPAAAAGSSINGDGNFRSPSLYDQFLTQKRRLGKEETTGQLLFTAGGGTGGTSSAANESNSNDTPNIRKDGVKPSIGLCEFYSSGSSSLMTAVNNR